METPLLPFGRLGHWYPAKLHHPLHNHRSVLPFSLSHLLKHLSQRGRAYSASNFAKVEVAKSGQSLSSQSLVKILEKSRLLLNGQQVSEDSTQLNRISGLF